MNRVVYVQRCGRWLKVPFDEIQVNEAFILCESDGTPVGHYVAASIPYKADGFGQVQTLEIKL